MMRTILLLDPIPPVTAARLAALLPEGFRLIHGPTREEDDLVALMPEADVVITGQLPVTARLIAAGAKLSLIHKWGVGVDNIDLAAARVRAIPVLRTTGSNAVPVAELTIGLMIAALRHIPYADRELRAGRWRWGRLPGDPLTLTGKTVGLVGFGAIGRRVARLLAGFEARVLYARRGGPASGDEADVGATRVELPELLERSDVVSLHCPLTPETTRLIDAAAFARMKSTAVLVNVARGGRRRRGGARRCAEPRLDPCRRHGRVRDRAAADREPAPRPRSPRGDPAHRGERGRHLRGHGPPHVREHRRRGPRRAAARARPRRVSRSPSYFETRS